MVAPPHSGLFPRSRLTPVPIAFKPPLWSLLPTALVLALFVTLGSWQLSRAHQKEALQAAFDAAGSAAVTVLPARIPPGDALSTHRVRTEGTFDASHQLLLDNQTRAQVPGYRVWTPLRRADGSWLIVDRGWVAADPDRGRLPSIDVAGDVREVSGFWRPLPEPGLRLASDPCVASGFPRVVSYPTREQLACVLGAPVADGVMLLDAALPDGYVREWTLPNPVPPARHYAYAAQWFAFAATLLFLFIKYSLKRLP